MVTSLSPMSLLHSCREHLGQQAQTPGTVLLPTCMWYAGFAQPSLPRNLLIFSVPLGHPSMPNISVRAVKKPALQIIDLESYSQAPKTHVLRMWVQRPSYVGFLGYFFVGPHFEP